MTEAKLGGLLGLARRAGLLRVGHDAALGALQAKTARLLLFAADASDRLFAEMELAAAKFSPETALVRSDVSMQALGHYIGKRNVAVLCVDDDGLAKRIQTQVWEGRQDDEEI